MIQEQRLEANIREIREQLLPLPTPVDGYVRVLLVGTTGAGKTTLVRQLLGIRPQTESFPSTAPGKTTTAEFEAILREGPFEAVITFISRQAVQIYIEECVLAAAQMCLEGRKDESVAQKLLEHEEQRFRLRYILGEFPARGKRVDQLNGNPLQSEVVAEEAQQFATIIKQYLDTIHFLVNACRENIEAEARTLWENAPDEDYEMYLQEQLEQEMRQHKAFQRLVDDIVGSVQQRFDLLTEGRIIRDQENWPLYWTFLATDRKEFLKTISTFSSNHFSHFGKLLTPLVQGMRIAGPFCPEWRTESAPRLVLIDGEGLGHTPSTAASLSTQITSRFEEADAILLVDSAKQPVQAASQAVLETVTTNGFASKLSVCFTHFEEVGGDTFPDRAARENHVQNSLDNVIAGIGKKSGAREKYTLRRSLDGRVFFLAHLQQRLTLKTQTAPNAPELPETREELRKMLAILETIQTPSLLEEIRPVYDEHTLFSHIQKAVKAFREKWRGILGLALIQGVLPEHWARIKALTRRPAFLGKDEYDTLKPVADLIKELSEQLKRFLEKPARWEPSYQGTEEARQVIVDAIARELYPQLHKLIRKQLISNPRSLWQTAFARQGRGSAKVRAYDIDSIYGAAAPTIAEIAQALELEPMYPPLVATLAERIEQSRRNARDELTFQVIEIVRQAIQSNSGRIIKA